MNEGVIASRYAKALLKFTQETGNGNLVYTQSCVIALRLQEIIQLRNYIENHEEIALEKKLQLLEAALGEPLAMEISRFITIVAEHRRMNCFMRMVYSFIFQYRKANNIKVGRLITAMPVDGLSGKMEAFLHEKMGAEIHLEMKVNPKILGGFVFELDDWRLDGSVENQFRRIRSQLIEKNNRIV